MDVLGIAYEQFTDAQREAVVATHPRGDASSAPTSAASYSAPPGHVNESSSYFGQRIIFEGLPSGRYMSAPHTYATDRLSLVLSGTWWVNSGADFDPDNTVPVPAGDSSGGSRGPPTMTGLRRTRTCRPSLLSSESHRFNSN